TGELATVDRQTERIKRPAPSIEDAANYYARLTGVSPQTFLAAARSFGVETRMRAADDQVTAMQVQGTPTLIVAGKYRVNLQSLHAIGDVIPLVNFLVAKASAH
ncbi:MAG TPA: hypothetical protein VHV80_07930, partial [Steroidobacteraceae bacterium]|nr:hypothetical protein [Steroidobacteraceae bacterium]